MEILISEFENIETKEKGFNVSVISRNKKRSVNDTDFFPDGSEIETKIQQLRKLLRQYFDANP